MSLVAPPPPPPEMDPPPLPDEMAPPLPLEPPPPGTAYTNAFQAYGGSQAYGGAQGATYTQAYQYAVQQQQQYSSQASHPGTHVGGSAAYPYAYHPMYQYPLQQSYAPQSHTAYSPYAQYPQAAWPSVPAQEHHAYQPAQYQAHSQVATNPHYATAAPVHHAVPSATVQPSAATGTPSIAGTAPFSFSLNTTSLQQPSPVAVQLPTPIYTKPVPKDDSTALKDWIRRGLAKHDKSKEAQIRDLMKGVIEDKKRKGIMYTHDWDREPIPSLSPLVSPPQSPSTASRVTRFQSSPRLPSPRSSNRTHAFTDPEDSRDDMGWGKKSKKKNNKKRRREAFEQHVPAALAQSTDGAWSAVRKEPIIGTCQNLEKPFLRLNAEPQPEKVRPEPVLIRALNRIAAVIAGGEKDFMYIWSQLKAIRQDLTVQHIRTATAVQVEELFARASLEHADQQEFRKCVSALQSYYDEGLPGCKAEFGAYQLLIYICDEQKNRGLSLSRAMPQLVLQGIWDAPEVVHAQQVLIAVCMSNYANFWRLYASAPRCSRLVMDWGVEKVRFDCMKMMTEAFKVVPLQSCMNLLGFGQPVLGNVGAGDPLAGCTSQVCVGAASVKAGEEAAQPQKCFECIEQHKGVVLRKQDGSYVFDAKTCVQKIVKPEKDQNTANAVGNTHLNISVFVKEKR